MLLLRRSLGTVGALGTCETVRRWRCCSTGAGAGGGAKGRNVF
jgi:hypothetical protein